MKVLFIGGTGLISSECAALALQSGIDLHLLTRGQHPHPTHRSQARADAGGGGGRVITADIRDPAAARAALAPHGRFDAVVNFIAYNPDDIARDLDLFTDRTNQYIFISTCAVYQKPPTHYLHDESTPLHNPFWSYARHKIAAENLLRTAYRETRFPFTIVRPSHTYADSRIPAAYHNSAHSWTTAWRLLNGHPVIIPGDGNTLWQVTHAADFAHGLIGLLGNPQTIGHAFHITTDEVLTWNQILATLADLLGTPHNFIHIPTDLIAHFDPERAAGLLGDKAHSIVFDNAKIKRFVPTYQPAIPFHLGLRRTLDWFRADPARQTIDPAYNALADQIIVAYNRAFHA